VPAVLGGFSRLVIDLNRDPSSTNSIPAQSDGIPIPRNQGLDDADRLARRTELFDPYHEAVATALDRARADGVAPAVVNVHSFTPALADGVHRPWQIGLLWRHDDRLVAPLQEHLHAEPGLAVGDNEPYSGHIHEGYTLPHHAEQPGLAHVLLEVRDDQLATDEGVEEWVDRLSGALDVARGRLVAER
jgi:predicted N-formylglutamate amidohydrolase